MEDIPMLTEISTQIHEKPFMKRQTV